MQPQHRELPHPDPRPDRCLEICSRCLRSVVPGLPDSVEMHRHEPSWSPVKEARKPDLVGLGFSLGFRVLGIWHGLLCLLEPRCRRL